MIHKPILELNKLACGATCSLQTSPEAQWSLFVVRFATWDKRKEPTVSDDYK